LCSLNMAITLVPKRNSPSEKSSAAQLGAVKPRIFALIWNLRCFDVSTIEYRGDWKADSFLSLINTTLADIFGENTPEYEEYSIKSLDTLPPTTDSEYPISEVIQAYKKGISNAVQKLNLLLENIDKSLSTGKTSAEPVPKAKETPTPPANEKVSLVTLRAMLGSKNHGSSSTIFNSTTKGKGDPAKTTSKVDVSTQRTINEELNKPLFNDRGVGTSNIDNDFGKSKKERTKPKDDEIFLVDEKQGPEPIVVNQGDDLTLEYLEALEDAKKAEGLEDIVADREEPEAFAINTDEEMVLDIAEDITDINLLTADTIKLDENYIPQDLLSEETIKNEPVTPQDIITLDADDLSATDVIATLTEELQPSAEESGQDATKYELLKEIFEELHYETPAKEEIFEEPGEPHLSPGSDINLTQDMVLPEPLVEYRIDPISWTSPTDLTEEVYAELENGDLPTQMSLEAPKEPVLVDHVTDDLPHHVTEGLSVVPELAIVRRLEECCQSKIEQIPPEFDQFIKTECALPGEKRVAIPIEPAVLATLLEKKQDNDHVVAAHGKRSTSDREALENIKKAEKRGDITAGRRKPKTYAISADEITILDFPEDVTSANQSVLDTIIRETLKEEDTLQCEAVASIPYVYKKPLPEPLCDELGTEEPHVAADAIIIDSDPLPESDTIAAFAYESLTLVGEDGIDISSYIQSSHENLERPLCDTAVDDIYADVSAPTYILTLLEDDQTPDRDLSELFIKEIQAAPPFTPDAAPAHETSPNELTLLNLPSEDILNSAGSRAWAALKQPVTLPLEEALLSESPTMATIPDIPKKGELPGQVHPELPDKPNKTPSTISYKGTLDATTELAAIAPEFDQNPFATTSHKKTQKPKAGIEDLQAQIQAITERIDDLKYFDVNTISQRYDPSIRQLHDSVNNTIAEIFGRNTRDYWDHSLASFESTHMGSKSSPVELRNSYKSGIDKAIKKLAALVTSLQTKLAKLHQEVMSNNEVEPSAGSHYYNSAGIAEEQKRSSTKPQQKYKEPIKDVVIEKPPGKASRTAESEQNPFAMSRTETIQKPKAGINDLQAQIQAITERIDDLKYFDVNSLSQRYDPRIRQLHDSINNTIAEIFGRNTRDYWDHSLASFESAHMGLGGAKSSLVELRNSYKSVIDKAIIKLTALAESLQTEL
jgi:hypothetical protein